MIAMQENELKKKADELQKQKEELQRQHDHLEAQKQEYHQVDTEGVQMRCGLQGMSGAPRCDVHGPGYSDRRNA